MFNPFSPSCLFAACGCAIASTSSAIAQNRYPVVVYQCNSSSFTGLSTTSTHLLDDANFEIGPYGPGFSGTRELTGLGFGYGVTGGVASVDFRISLYRPSDVNWSGFAVSGSPLINPLGAPYYILTVSGVDTNVCPGLTTAGPFAMFPNPVTVPTGDSGVVVDLAAVKAGTPSSAPLNSETLAGPTSISRVSLVLARLSDVSVGSSTSNAARDSNNDGLFGVSEKFSAASNAQIWMTLYGNQDAPPAPSATDLSTTTQTTVGNTTISGSLTPSAPVAWYRFNLPAGVSFDANTYLDIDTEGSAAPVAIALYAINSTPFSVATSRGSGPDTPPSFDNLNAFQLSFGLPARPGIGNGDRYSGQEGDLPAGDYYLAVYDAANGAGDAWSIGGGPSLAAPIAYNLNFSTNLGNPSVLPPVLPPLVEWDFGIAESGEISASFAVRSRDVGWVRFALTNPVPLSGQFAQNTGNPLSDVTYLDITQPGSSITGEWNFALYNSAGTLANASSISYAGAGFNANNGGGDGPFGCGGSFGQLSYGTEPSRGLAPLDPGLTTLGKPLNNQNGAALAADEYYLAVSLGDAQFKPSRFGARSTRGSSVSASITIGTNNRVPGPGCPADFNGDGGVDDADFGFFAIAYNNLTDLVGDLNADTFSDDADFALFAAAYDALLCP